MIFSNKKTISNQTPLSPGELIRNKSFWMRDWLKGSPIRRHTEDLHRLLNNSALRSKEIQNRQSELLNHANKTVPFYRDYSNSENLSCFPVISKDVLKREYDRFFSSKYSREDLVQMTTTGSYGTPFKFYLSQEKRYRQLAEIIYFSNWAGYRVGMKYAQMRGTAHKKFRSWMQNEVLINPWLMDDNWLSQSRDILLNKNIRFLFEYPSPMVFLAKFCQKQGDSNSDFGVIGACTSSENLSPAMKNAIKDTFGGMVLSRYASQENGILAHEHPDYGSKMLINEASHVLEFLEFDSDRPVKPGEPGRIVVTDLYSHAMPLIRYDIGDTGVLSEIKSEPYQLSIIDRLEGRIIEGLTNTRGEFVSPYLIVTGLWGIEGIVQCQFVQQSSDQYLMRMVVDDSFRSEAEVLNRIMPYLGQSANVRFEYLDQIAPLPSGKRPQVLNEWKRKCG